MVCLNSATAAEELNLRVLGIGSGDEVVVPAYTYTASASAAIHCGATVKFIDIQKDVDSRTHCPEMDYDALEAAITPATKAIIPVDLGGIVCDYEKVFEIVERKKGLFKPLESDGTPLGDLSSRIQKSLGRVVVVCDAAHALGASRYFHGKRRYVGVIADFTSFSFHAVKNFTTAEGGASTWKEIPGIENKEIYKFYQLLSLKAWGLVGVAIGTLVSMLYQTIWMAFYNAKNLVKRSIKVFTKQCIVDTITVGCFALIPIARKLTDVSYLNWIILAIETAMAFLAVTALINFVFYRKYMLQLPKTLMNKRVKR